MFGASVKGVIPGRNQLGRTVRFTKSCRLLTITLCSYNHRFMKAFVTCARGLQWTMY